MFNYMIVILRRTRKAVTLRDRILLLLTKIMLGTALILAIVYGTHLNMLLFPATTQNTHTFAFDTAESAPLTLRSEPGIHASIANHQLQLAIASAGTPFTLMQHMTSQPIHMLATKIAQVPGVDAEAGLVFLFMDERNYYLFTASNNGYFTITRTRDGTRYLITHQLNDQVRAHHGANQLSISAHNALLHFSIDGTKVYEIYNGEQDLGEVGIGVTGAYDAEHTTVFDNLMLQYEQ